MGIVSSLSLPDSRGPDMTVSLSPMLLFFFSFFKLAVSTMLPIS